MNYKIIFLLLITSTTFSQNLHSPLFTVVENSTVSVNNDSIDYFPLSDGDFWEYIERDTVTISNFTHELDFSVGKEVIGDTLMNNGLIYKIVKWEYCANSVDKEPWYEYLRKDSINNVHIYHNNEDLLLYDFTIEEHFRYPSHYEGHTWEVKNKYVVEVSGEQLAAIDLELLNENWFEVYEVRLVENLGLIEYTNNQLDTIRMSGGGFYGGVIGGSTYGELLAKKQEIDWSEFYPLHIGDFWKYSGRIGHREYFKTVEVIGDTLIDGKIFKKLLNADNEYGWDTSFAYKYFDDNVVFSWQPRDSTTIVDIKFSSCLGDTFSTQWKNSFYRFDEKGYEYIHFFKYPDLTYEGYDYTRELGLTNQTFQGGWEFLIGAIIDGEVFGDTSIVTSVEEVYKVPSEFKLYQNYPNPFNPTTTIEYTIPEYTKVLLKIYDLLGQEVETLVNEEKFSGTYSVNFTADKLSSGIYLYMINTSSFRDIKKLILLK